MASGVVSSCGRRAQNQINASAHLSRRPHSPAQIALGRPGGCRQAAGDVSSACDCFAGFCSSSASEQSGGPAGQLTRRSPFSAAKVFKAKRANLFGGRLGRPNRLPASERALRR